MLQEIVQDLEMKGWSLKLDVVDQKTLKRLSVLFEDHFNPAHIGKGVCKTLYKQIRGDTIRWLDVLEPEEEVKPLLDIVQELKQHLNQKFFLGIKDFECHLTKYPPNTFYKKHLDRFNSDSSRIVSFIFYLHQSWEISDGGELILYDKQGNIIQSILPMPGSMVCFMSDEIPHEVLTTFKERRSLTGWMRTEIVN